MFGSIFTISKLHRLSLHRESFGVFNIFKQNFHLTILNTKSHHSIIGIRNFSGTKIFTNRLWCYTRGIFKWNYHSQQILPVRTNVNQHYLNVTSKLLNNVMLFRHEKSYHYQIAFGISVIGLLACLLMADNVYRYLCKDLFNSDIPLKERFMSHLFPITVITVGVLAGPAIAIMMWFITVRSIKYVILHKGGEKVTIVTHHPIRGEMKRTLPLKDVSCIVSRTDTKHYASFKIKNVRFRYLLNKDGHFVNPELFDNTVGLKRFN